MTNTGGSEATGMQAGMALRHLAESSYPDPQTQDKRARSLGKTCLFETSKLTPSDIPSSTRKGMSPNPF